MRLQALNDSNFSRVVRMRRTARSSWQRISSASVAREWLLERADETHSISVQQSIAIAAYISATRKRDQIFSDELRTRRLIESTRFVFGAVCLLRPVYSDTTQHNSLQPTSRQRME